MQSLALRKIREQLSRDEELKIRVHELERASGQKRKREFLRPLPAGEKGKMLHGWGSPRRTRVFEKLMAGLPPVVITYLALKPGEKAIAQLTRPDSELGTDADNASDGGARSRGGH